jgi:hypothetical protein
MRPVRFLRAVALLFLLSLAWNGIVHLFVLRDINASVAGLRRPMTADVVAISLAVAFLVDALFLFGYDRFARSGTRLEAWAYGLFFAALTGVLVDLNQLALYPIPWHTATAWFAGGVAEFSLYGLLAPMLRKTWRKPLSIS